MDVVKKVDIYYKECVAIAPLAVAKGLFLLAPLLTLITNKIKQASSLKESLEEVIKNLNEYKSEYSFEKYDAYVKEFLNNCVILNNLFENIGQDVNKVKQFIELAYKIQMSGQTVKAYIDELKNAGGKAFDMADQFGMSFGFDTLSTKLSKSIDILYKQLSMEVPKFESMYKDLSMKMLESETTNPSKESTEKSEFDDFANISF